MQSVNLLDVKPGITYETCSPTGRKQAHVVLNQTFSQIKKALLVVDR